MSIKYESRLLILYRRRDRQSPGAGTRPAEVRFPFFPFPFMANEGAKFKKEDHSMMLR